MDKSLEKNMRNLILVIVFLWGSLCCMACSESSDPSSSPQAAPDSKKTAAEDAIDQAQRLETVACSTGEADAEEARLLVEEAHAIELIESAARSPEFWEETVSRRERVTTALTQMQAKLPDALPNALGATDTREALNQANAAELAAAKQRRIAAAKQLLVGAKKCLKAKEAVLELLARQREAYLEGLSKEAKPGEPRK